MIRWFACLLLFFPLLAQAQQCRVGDVVRVVGEAAIYRDTRTFRPFEGLSICRGDRIVTSAAAVVELRLRDGTLLTVGRASEFVIRDYRIYKDQPNVALFDLARGAFRSVTGFITKRPHRYEVRTRVATIGVRGTDFWGGFGLTGDGLDVVMLSGKGVYVDSAQGRVELDRAGLGTTVMPGQLPQPAKAWGEEKLARAVATITP